MNEVQRSLTANVAGAFDRYQDYMSDPGPTSYEGIKRATPLVAEMVLAQWAASLDIKTRHDLMKSSIDSIR